MQKQKCLTHAQAILAYGLIPFIVHAGNSFFAMFNDLFSLEVTAALTERVY